MTVWSGEHFTGTGKWATRCTPTNVHREAPLPSHYAPERLVCTCGHGWDVTENSMTVRFQGLNGIEATCPICSKSGPIKQVPVGAVFALSSR